MSMQAAGARWRLLMRSADASAEPGSWRRTKTRVALGIVLLLLLVLYSWLPIGGHWNVYDFKAHHRDQYNVLADGMLGGHLYLDEQVPAGLLALVDPYNPSASRKYRDEGLWDQSFYHGHCYLYFGVTPVVSLYLPYRLFTAGLRLQNPVAVLIFSYSALLFATGLLCRLKRRYFDQAPDWMLVASVLMIGAADVAPYLMSQPEIYQVAISSGMCFSLGSLYFLSRAFESAARRSAWLVLAGIWMALAVGSRPHFALSMGIVFLVALVTLWRRGERRISRFAPLVLPFSAGGFLLGLYNYLRFGSFFEFGSRFQLTLIDMRSMGMFGIQRIPSTLYFMFLQPPTINTSYPYIHPMPKLPVWMDVPNGFMLERVTGVLTWVPFLWVILLALVVAWRQRRAESGPLPRFELTCLVAAAAAVIAVLANAGGTMRYLADFAALLELTAVLCWFYVDQRLASAPSLRTAVRVLGLVLLLLAVVFGPALALPAQTHYMDG